MFARLAEASMSLDIETLLFIAATATVLLGLFLIFASLQDRVQALAWWGTAYLIGGFSGAFWQFGDVRSAPVLSNATDILLFIAVGMIWSAARLFHGRPVLWLPMCLGAGAWLAACSFPSFTHSPTTRVLLSSLIVASYTFLIAIELWRERRKSLIRRWPAIFVPMLHGAIFLLPVTVKSLGIGNLGTIWVDVFALEVMLYVVGAAFIVMLLAKERTVRIYKTAAATDSLTGILNRRGFFEAADAMMARYRPGGEPVSVIAFDLDQFKSINDRFGHQVGDAVLTMFADVARTTMRTGDVIGRVGGEEFVAILQGSSADAGVAAERVRAAFAAATLSPDRPQIRATVSVGVACGAHFDTIETLVARADSALYRAKANGRNRVETAADLVTGELDQSHAGIGELIESGNAAAAM
jgi:diguanylate cyclase (GGDEF)-like protein